MADNGDNTIPPELQNQLMGVARALLSFIGGMAVGRGWLTMEQVGQLVELLMQIIGPLAGAGVLFWTWKANNKKSVITAAARMPEVKSVVVTDSSLANSIPRPEVTSAKRT